MRCCCISGLDTVFQAILGRPRFCPRSGRAKAEAPLPGPAHITALLQCEACTGCYLRFCSKNRFHDHKFLISRLLHPSSCWTLKSPPPASTVRLCSVDRARKYKFQGPDPPHRNPLCLLLWCWTGLADAPTPIPLGRDSGISLLLILHCWKETLCPTPESFTRRWGNDSSFFQPVLWRAGQLPPP